MAEICETQNDKLIGQLRPHPMAAFQLQMRGNNTSPAMYDLNKTDYVVETTHVVMEHGYKSSQLKKINATTKNVYNWYWSKLL